MILLLIFVTVILAATVFVFVLSLLEARTHATSVGEEFAGICKSAVETASRKEQRKQKILELFAQASASAQRPGKTVELSNAEIRKALGVSSRTTVRYLDELEAEGKVEQVGKAGQAVTYRPK